MADASNTAPRNGPTSGAAARDLPSCRVLVPVADPPQSDGTATVARALARENDCDVLVAQIVSVPYPTPLELPDRHLAPFREALRESMESIADSGSETPVEGVVRVGHRAVEIVAHTAEDHDVTTIVTDWPDRRPALAPFRRAGVEWLYANTSSRLVVSGGAGDLSDVSSILVPIADGPHSGTAVDVARALAARHDAWIELLHVVDPDPTAERRREARQRFEAGGDRLSDFERWDTWLLEAEDVAEAIVEQSAYYDVTVLGAPRSGRLRRFVFGSTATDVRAGAEGAVLTVWSE